MQQDFPTIYRAKNLQEAQLLCNALENEGIRATVTNSVLENGAGSEVMGWATLPRVMVAREDAPRARNIAIGFDRAASRHEGQVSSPTFAAANDRLPSIGEEPEACPSDTWPRCPECGERRHTRCEFCGTAGNDFPPADANGDDLLGLPTPGDAAYSDCSCGAGGCGTAKHDEAAGTSDSIPEAESRPLLLCPTCDEPFHPQYLRCCEWCGHEFPDGVEPAPPEEQAAEAFNWRIAYVIYAMAVLALAAAVYLIFLFS
jgi:hypothetical protein